VTLTPVTPDLLTFDWVSCDPVTLRLMIGGLTFDQVSRHPVTFDP